MLLLVMVFITGTESTVGQTIRMQSQLSMMAHTYNPSILEVEARGVALSPRPLQMHSEFQATLAQSVKPPS